MFTPIEKGYIYNVTYSEMLYTGFND